MASKDFFSTKCGEATPAQKIPTFRNIPRAPCSWCGCLNFNGTVTGEIHCGGCESGSANDQPVVIQSHGVTLPKGHAGRAVLVEHGYVRRWTLAVDSGYDPDSETSRLAHIYPEVLWTYDPTPKSKEDW